MTKKELRAKIIELEERADHLTLLLNLERMKPQRSTPQPWTIGDVPPWGHHAYAYPPGPYITWASNRTNSEPPPNCPVQYGFNRELPTYD